MINKLVVIAIFTISFGCKKPDDIKVGLQPIHSVDKNVIDTIKNAIEIFYGYEVERLASINVPQKFYVRENRFRADSMIQFLKTDKNYKDLDYVIGITTEDISTTKFENGEIKSPVEKYKDWGVFGLGYLPGKSCIVSSYRLKNADKTIFYDRIKKVALHELGHNLGLPHCSGDRCFMKDANESIKTIDQESNELCSNCKLKLKVFSTFSY